MKTVIYMYPPGGRERDWEYSLGLSYIVAYLKKKGIQAYQYVPSAPKTIDEVVSDVVKMHPDILGFSCYDTNYYYVKLLVEEIKEKLPSVLIVVGGPTATFSYRDIMSDCLLIDVCIIGEGELTNYEIIKNIECNMELNSIKGIVFRQGDEIIVTKSRNMVRNIDDFPSPYLMDTGIDNNDRLIVLTSRGCVFNCIYCNCTVMNDKTIRFHTVKRVIEELQFIQKKYGNQKEVLIGDDAFTLNIGRAKEICREIINQQIKLNLFCETRVEYVDDELLSLLKEAGFSKIDFGLESANIKTLKIIKKCTSKGSTEGIAEEKFLYKMKEIIRKVKNLKLIPMVNIIAGLPGETVTDIENTLKYVAKLEIQNYSHNILRPYAGTELFNDAEWYGYKIERTPFFLPYMLNHSKEIINVAQLDSSISRFENRLLKENLASILSGIGSMHFEIYESIAENGRWNREKTRICINEDIFLFSRNNIDEIEMVNQIVKSRIASNKINFITSNYKVYSYLEKQNNFEIGVTDLESLHKYNNKNLKLIEVKSAIDIEKIFCKTITNPFVRRDVCVLNQCKFCGPKCILRNRSRGVKRNDGKIDLCFMNQYVIDEYDREWFIKELEKKEYVLRGCANCLVKNECPKCLIPYPLGRDEYCIIMKNYSFQFANIDYVEEFCRQGDVSLKEKKELLDFVQKVGCAVSEIT